MEVILKGAFVGAVTRKSKDGTKQYADLHAAVAMRQGEGAVGHDVRSFRMDPSLFAKLRSFPLFAPITITCEESEYNREGGTETVKVVVDVVADKTAKAA